MAKQFSVLMVAALAVSSVASLPISPPDKGAWDTGEWRNLFVESGLHTEGEVSSKLETIYDQLFFGDDDTERVFYWQNSTDEAMGYILSIDSNDIRSEGMSYGSFHFSSILNLV